MHDSVHFYTLMTLTFVDRAINMYVLASEYDHMKTNESVNFVVPAIYKRIKRNG